MPDAKTLTLADVEAMVSAAMAAGLPGQGGQRAMAPRPRPEWPLPDLPPGTRQAAALLLLFPTPGGPGLVLTKRASGLPQHPGQVSLPGGAVEEGERVEAAALREAHEEVGVDTSAVRVVGVLTPLHIPVSGFAVHPVVGVCEAMPAFRPADREVERVFAVTLGELADPARVRRTTRTHQGMTYDVPYFDVAGEMVWGATAMILAELLDVLGRGPSPWQ
jgi:8-oxo-dGTP pyrophosphatase MutT (NUDIX family)